VLTIEPLHRFLTPYLLLVHRIFIFLSIWYSNNNIIDLQFFLSNRAVYILLWNMRMGFEHAGLDFWLSSVACHAPETPILVVGTQSDQVHKLINNYYTFHFVISTYWYNKKLCTVTNHHKWLWKNIICRVFCRMAVAIDISTLWVWVTRSRSLLLKWCFCVFFRTPFDSFLCRWDKSQGHDNKNNKNQKYICFYNSVISMIIWLMLKSICTLFKVPKVDIPEKDLKLRYPQITNFHYVSSIKGDVS